MKPSLTVLGIETSCDETAAAVVTEGRLVLSNIVLSQFDEHRPHGGVVPEIAARAHLQHLDGIVRRAMDEAGLALDQLDGIAATGGPGLIGGVIVGVMTAKAMAASLHKPFLAVNHLEAHALTARLTPGVEFPYLLLLVSGGHCQLLAGSGVGQYRRLGTTIDDAVGEAFDKAAKLLGLGYPGGPLMEQAAARAQDAGRFDLPVPMKGRPGCDFSFSGLKTAVRRHVERLGTATDQDVADLAAAFHNAVAGALVDRTKNAIAQFRDLHGPDAKGAGSLVVAGGVAANRFLRGRLQTLADREGMAFVAPPPALCTDNGAMVAWAGAERLVFGWTDTLDIEARARWPLDPHATPALGAGKQGAKA
jgi:N6-L-threonylcarbamoyladenine synthase